MSRERRGAGGVPNAAAALGCRMGPRKRAARSGAEGPPRLNKDQARVIG